MTLCVVQRNFKRDISEPVELCLSKPTPEMWDKVLTAFRNTLDKAENAYLTKAKSTSATYRTSGHIVLRIYISGFNCTEQENATALSTLRRRAWIALRSKIDEQTADQSFLAKLRTYFEERFRYDEKGVPRVWTPSDDIDGAFAKAKDEVSSVVLAFRPALMGCSRT